MEEENYVVQRGVGTFLKKLSLFSKGGDTTLKTSSGNVVRTSDFSAMGAGGKFLPNRGISAALEETGRELSRRGGGGK